MNIALQTSLRSCSQVFKSRQLNQSFNLMMRFNSSYASQFEEAKTNLKKLNEDPGQDVQLKIYGLFKQSTVGPVEGKRPGMMDFVGRAKYDAWSQYKDLNTDDAMKAYVELVGTLLKAEAVDSAEASASGDQTYKNFLVEMDGGLRKLTLNRPKKKNAITSEMYDEWIVALKDAAEDKKTVITAITGAGDYYCSGNDLSNFMNVTPDTIKQVAKDSNELLKRFVAAFIEFPKPLVGVINGPAVGIAVTTLGLFDAVYSTDKATFHTPFSALGQSPEGCSSYTFPKLMGTSKASELLYFNKKITAKEAERCGLVSEVFPDSSFQSEIWPRLQKLSELPINSLVYSKQLGRAIEGETLHKVNEIECERLEERWTSDDCRNAIMAFFTKKAPQSKY